jgi:pyruvate kinase
MRRHQGDPPRQTCIVATVGLCRDVDWPTYLDALTEAGVDVLRLNLSHADADYAKEAQVLAWSDPPDADERPLRPAVLVDLQGPKSRIGTLPGTGLDLQVGQTLALVPEGEEAEAQAEGAVAPQIPLPQPLGAEVMRALQGLAVKQPGLKPRVVFGDGEPVVEVQSLGQHHAQAVVVAGGRLGSRKGVTIRDVDPDLDPFPEKDQRDLDFCLQHRVDFVAVSFVRTAQDLHRVRAYIRDHLPPDVRPPRLVAKIETRSALENLTEILAATDAILIARGDLGLQLGVEEVPRVQKQLVTAAREAGKPVIVATQMLESMVTAPAPTRAEATDVFNAIVDGGDAVMLSGETSVGTRPCEVVATMDRLARKAEAWCDETSHLRRLRGAQDGDPGAGSSLGRIHEGMALAAVQLADEIQARAIVCFTRSGRTAARLSRYRPEAPVLAFFRDEARARAAVLCFGVHPILLRDHHGETPRLSQLVTRAREIMRRDWALRDGEALVVTAGVDWPRGGTNALQVVVEGVDGATVADHSRT